MIQKMVTSAVFAGCVAGLLAALLHFAFVQKLILLAEEYETGALVHFQGVAGSGASHDHDHAAETAEPTESAAEPTEEATAAPTHDHDHMHAEEGEDDSPIKRNTLTIGFFALVYTGYAMLLVAGFGLVEIFGKTITAREGLLWGIAGYAAFQLMPAMGLSPEPPGIPAADLQARQIWWLCTAISTAVALGLIGYLRNAMTLGIAVILLAAPHIIGAPEVEVFSGVAPPEVSAAFAARSLGTGLMIWSALGWLAGKFWSGKTA